MRIVRINLSLIAAVFAVSLLAGVPVSAQHVDDRGPDRVRPMANEVRTGLEVHQSVDQELTVTSDTRVQLRSGNAGNDERVKALRAQALQELSDHKSRREQRPQKARQQACEARRTNLTRKIENYSSHAARHLSRYDAAFERLQAYKVAHDVQVTDYQDLIAAAGSGQIAARQSVAALEAVSTDFDCTAADPAATVATVRTAVKSTRSALKDYRDSVKDLLVALMSAKPGNTDAEEANR